MAAKSIRLKRAYDPPAKSDGLRILVDRLWPRGVSKDAAAIDEWLKDIAPSTELRRWFGHDPEKWDEFARRFRAELAEPGPAKDALAQLRQLAKTNALTLVFAAKDEAHNNAVVLKALLAK